VREVEVAMMMEVMMMVLEGAEEVEELYSSILQDLLMLLVQLTPEVETVEIMAEITMRVELEEEVLVEPLYFKVQM